MKFNRKMVIALCNLTNLSLFSSANAAVWFENDDNQKKTKILPIHNDQFLELSEVTGQSLLLQAELALRARRTERALELTERGLLKDDQDIDLHRVHAEAIEQKMAKQSAFEACLFNECVREWLLVLRPNKGEEKGLNFCGINPASTFYQDDERQGAAARHLTKLTGRAPKLWETDKRYLKSVLQPLPEVSGKVIYVREK